MTYPIDIATPKIIHSNGIITDLIPVGKKIELEEAQKVVGGFIEILGLGRVNDVLGVMILNEEGKLFGLPFNKAATEMLKLAYPGSDDYICGDVIVCKKTMI